MDNATYIIIGIIIAAAFILDCIVKTKYNDKQKIYEEPENETEEDKSVNQPNGKTYYRSYLLTRNESRFYKQTLKPLADKYNLHVLSKVRLEDIAKVSKNIKGKEKNIARNRVKCRHVDFVIANPENLYMLCAIELDGKSHNLTGQKESDDFKNNLFDEIGLPLIRTNGTEDIEKELCEKIKIPVKQ